MLSEKLARFIAKTKYEDLPEHVVEFTKLCILDWFGSAVAGSSLPPIRMLHELAEELGGAPQATLVTGGRSSVANAALVNGGASHIVELDDIHKSSIIHAATVVVPAALAVAEWKGKSGKDLIAAVAVGYDVCFRIGEAVSPSHYYYWHNTATCGTFGSVAAAAKLLDLTEEQMIHALGNAGTQAAGLWEFIVDGAMTKQLHPGKAAMNGVLAALLGQKGFTGPSRILEGKRGFFEAMSEQANPNAITDGLAEQYKITENSFKIHASCRHTHQAIDIALDIRRERQLNPEEIEEITVRTYQSALMIASNTNPQTVYASKFSVEFCTALGFIKGRAGLAEFNEETLHDPAVRALMGKIHAVLDPAIEEDYPEKWRSAMDIKLRSGESISRMVDYPKGDPENPVTADELVTKFKQLAAALPAEQIERHVRAILELERTSNVSDWFGAAAGSDLS